MIANRQDYIMKYFIPIFLILSFNSLCSQDTSAYKSIILSSKVFSEKRLQESQLSITDFSKIRDTIFLNVVLTAKNGLSYSKYGSIITENSKFKLQGDYLDIFNNGYNTFKSIGKNIENKNNGISYGFTDDKLNGIKSIFENQGTGVRVDYMEGKVSQIFNYSNDTLDGGYIIFYDNQSIKESGSFTKGIRTGVFLSYYEDGSLKCKGFYSGSYISAKPELGSDKMEFFINDRKKINFIKDYSIILRTEMSEEMKKEGGYENFKYFLKQGEWLYYNGLGQLTNRIVYDKNGNINLQ